MSQQNTITTQLNLKERSLWEKLGVTLISIYSIFLFTDASANRMPREMQQIWVDDGGYEVTLPNDPAWLWQVNQISGHPTFTTQTPEFFYPPINLSITTYKDIKVNPKQLEAIARSSFDIARKNYQSNDESKMKVIKSKKYVTTQRIQPPKQNRKANSGNFFSNTSVIA